MTTTTSSDVRAELRIARRTIRALRAENARLRAVIRHEVGRCPTHSPSIAAGCPICDSWRGD